MNEAAQRTSRMLSEFGYQNETFFDPLSTLSNAEIERVKKWITENIEAYNTIKHVHQLTCADKLTDTPDTKLIDSYDDEDAYQCQHCDLTTLKCWSDAVDHAIDVVLHKKLQRSIAVDDIKELFEFMNYALAKKLKNDELTPKDLKVDCVHHYNNKETNVQTTKELKTPYKKWKEAELKHLIRHARKHFEEFGTITESGFTHYHRRKRLDVASTD